MRNKAIFLTGVGVGYVLGAKAGRARYESIKAHADGIWHDPRVQEKVGDASAVVKEKVTDAGAAVKDLAARTGVEVPNLGLHQGGGGTKSDATADTVG